IRSGARAFEALQSGRKTVVVECEADVGTEKRKPDAVDEHVAGLGQRIRGNGNDARRAERAGRGGKLRELRIAGSAGDADSTKQLAVADDAFVDAVESRRH